MRARSLLKQWPRAVLHAFLLGGALIMLYPLLWMVSASLKPEHEIFINLGLIPHEFTLDNYFRGWTALRTPFTRFYINSLVLCALCVVGNIVSCALASFAFARLQFRLRRVWFALMFLTIMLPGTVTIVPQFIVFNQLGWVGTLLPIVLPKFLAVDTFFVFLMVQFVRTIPRELDDSAKIDGCGPYRLFFHVVLPLMTPAMATTAIFTFLWTWNDFFGQLLYLGNSIKSFTVPLGLYTFVDATATSSWGGLLAMSTLSLIPILGVFIGFQRLLIDGISTTGLK